MRISRSLQNENSFTLKENNPILNFICNFEDFILHFILNFIFSIGLTAHAQGPLCEKIFDDSSISASLTKAVKFKKIEIDSTNFKKDWLLKYPDFFRQLGFFISPENPNIFYRPEDPRDLNRFIFIYNLTKAKGKKIHVRFYKVPEEIVEDEVYFNAWSKGLLPASDFHDWVVHVPVFLKTPEGIMEKSIHNYRVLREFFNSALIQNHPALKQRMIQELINGIENLMLYEKQEQAYFQFLNWSAFVITPDYFNRSQDHLLKYLKGEDLKTIKEAFFEISKSLAPLTRAESDIIFFQTFEQAR